MLLSEENKAKKGLIMNLKSVNYSNKQNQGDIIYDHFMFQTLEVKLNALIYLIRVLKKTNKVITLSI